MVSTTTPRVSLSAPPTHARLFATVELADVVQRRIDTATAMINRRPLAGLTPEMVEPIISEAATWNIPSVDWDAVRIDYSATPAQMMQAVVSWPLTGDLEAFKWAPRKTWIAAPLPPLQVQGSHLVSVVTAPRVNDTDVIRIATAAQRCVAGSLSALWEESHTESNRASRTIRAAIRARFDLLSASDIVSDRH